ncbi:hypothetical protein TH61_07080 [Rufibacter sp. DG15C]|uniref:hypothetical protein n=1 Tax=Rufibacter sp. DG15C TaxID=1379909 RepID=UPI00078B4ACE|nr:hypothetical protein [Rufibacter sp. DG15C]AMM50994.1 hypothetical protein TH61_07080 [Rufibacter sp. DG15C]
MKVDVGSKVLGVNSAMQSPAKVNIPLRPPQGENQHLVKEVEVERKNQIKYVIPLPPSKGDYKSIEKKKAFLTCFSETKPKTLSIYHRLQGRR